MPRQEPWGCQGKAGRRRGSGHGLLFSHVCAHVQSWEGTWQQRGRAACLWGGRPQGAGRCHRTLKAQRCCTLVDLRPSLRRPEAWTPAPRTRPRCARALRRPGPTSAQALPPPSRRAVQTDTREQVQGRAVAAAETEARGLSSVSTGEAARGGARKPIQAAGASSAHAARPALSPSFLWGCLYPDTMTLIYKFANIFNQR